MPRATTNKLYRTFVKGLITEAGPLTYPENASINEDNCILYQSGNRSRRKGIDLEDGALYSPFNALGSQLYHTAISEHVWQSANNDSQYNFAVIQVGAKLYFYDMAQSTLSSGLKSFNVDLGAFAVSGVDVGSQNIQAVPGKGYLFVVSPLIEPFLIQYNPSSDSITTQRIYIQIRDFKGLDDGLANDAEPTTLSPEHNYNLLNQGWLDPTNNASGSDVTYYGPFGTKFNTKQAAATPISSYFTAYSRYPGNNKQWWVAKSATDGTFDPTLLGKFYFGNNRAPRGHYIVEAFNIDRSAVSGVAGIPVEKINNRPTSVAFFSGRVWYVVDSTVYFSQVLDDKRKAGFCYMDADPTSEDINDLIATDGGVIPIPEMIKGLRLVPIAGGVMVFATNGLWYISGTNSGFTAMDITVTKVSPIGTDSPMSIVHVEDGNNDLLLYWSKVGIQALQQRMGSFGAISDKFDTSILSQTTIQSFYNAIPKNVLPYVKSHYDPQTNTVQWLFNEGSVPYFPLYNRVLNFDLTLKAFYPWTVSDFSNGPYLAGVFETIKSTGRRNAFTKYLVVSAYNDSFSFTFAEEKNTDFKDWNLVGYNSFIESGYELLEDAMRNKQALYVYSYFRRTEDAYVMVDGEYQLHNPSSCYFQVKWDWSSSSISNRWSSKMQAYRQTRIPQFSEDDLGFDTGFAIVVSRNKVRGHGRAIQFRFESDEIGKDFDLLGWAVPYSGNTAP